MDKCVHCGFCLPTCPSYVLLGQEMDSPRGRIYLMRAGIENRVSMQPSVVQHFDTCLGCMACETACPSGVKYAPLIEQTRAAIESQHQRPASEQWFRRLLFSVLPYPARLRLLAIPLAVAGPFRRSPAFTRLLPERLRTMLTLAPSVSIAETRRETAELTAAQGSLRGRVGLVTGCVQRAFFGSVNRATARVLSAEGFEVHAPRSQGCCGALALHAGEDETARDFARALIATFERAGVDTIAVNAAGCGSAMKEYGHLLRNDSVWAERAAAFSQKVRDVTEILATCDPPRASRRPLTRKVAYHDACHLAHAQGVRAEPRKVLASIPGVTVVPFEESEICCGSAGIFNLVQPELASQLGKRKADNIANSAPDVVVTSNPGCILQIRSAAAQAGHSYRVMHIVELLDQALS
jgi:glycolate dehydrogenase iron-sulfur subunit